MLVWQGFAMCCLKICHTAARGWRRDADTYPLVAFILLTGGNSATPFGSIGLWLIIGLAVISVGRMAKQGYLGANVGEFHALIGLTAGCL